MDNRTDKIKEIKKTCLECRKCSIGGCRDKDGHTSNVFSNMNCKARYMVVGQNPGAEERKKGEPFVGISGRTFDAMMEEHAGLKRSDFYITNICKCVTPDNRKPRVKEMETCESFIVEEIAILHPEIIISLGGPAFRFLTGVNGIMKHHGSPVFSPRYGIYVFPVLHPSPLNLNNPSKREMFISDLNSLKVFIEERENG